jgi:hypothetical protein
MQLAPGSRLGPYEILAPLGAGGMGEVYRARDPRMGREVAIKLSAERFSDRFEREVRAIAALNHPHICTLHDVGPNYLVMELVEGSALKGPMPAAKAVEYASQILDALDAAHRKGFTHRDLKPANILATKQGIKLLDFGLVKQNAPLAETESTVTEKGQIVGTLPYMAPEQLQGKEADARSDLFAFGCVLYEMLSGKRAFSGPERDSAELELRPPLGPVIKRCLAQDPDERFQTARDLKYNLRVAMEQPAAAPKPKPWFWLAMAAALVLGGLAGWVVSRFSQASAEPQAVRLEINPPEGGQSDATSLAVSPDSRTLAFVATVQGKRALWIRPLDASASRLLPGTDGAYYPFWSPDSLSVAYFAANKLWRVELAGGAPFAICDAGLGRGTWSDDGVIVFSALVGGLRRVPASGGSPAPLTMVAHREISHDAPQFLSDGRFLYWIRGNEQNAGTYTSTLDHPAQRIRVIGSPSQAVYAAGHLLWRHGSTLVAQRFDPDRLKLSGDPQPVANPVSGDPLVGRTNLAAASGVLLYSSLDHDSRLTWFDGTGKALGTLGEPGAFGTFRLSPDTRRAAVTRASGASTDLWIVEIGRNIWSRLAFTMGINAVRSKYSNVLRPWVMSPTPRTALGKRYASNSGPCNVVLRPFRMFFTPTKTLNNYRLCLQSIPRSAHLHGRPLFLGCCPSLDRALSRRLSSE